VGGSFFGIGKVVCVGKLTFMGFCPETA